VICTAATWSRFHTGSSSALAKPQEGDVQDGLFAQEVVDAKDLVFVQHLVQLVVELAGRGEVVAEGLLDHHGGPPGEMGLTEGRHYRCEQRRRDLEVEQRPGKALKRLDQHLVGGGVCEITVHVAEPACESIEDLVFHRLPGRLEGRPCRAAQMVFGPLLLSNADDRAVEALGRFEAVERPKGHLLGEVAGDPKDDEDVGYLWRGRAHMRCSSHALGTLWGACSSARSGDRALTSSAWDSSSSRCLAWSSPFLHHRDLQLLRDHLDSSVAGDRLLFPLRRVVR